MIRNGVIPVAGVGTRLLPSTKSQPKEMLPIGRKPVVQYVVEELHASGVNSMLFVTGRNKRSIEDHFDLDRELVENLKNSGKDDLLREIDFERLNIKFHYTRQSEQLGLGHAVGFAEDFCRTEPFVVALGDSIIKTNGGGEPLVARLVKCFEETGASAAIAFQEVAREDVFRYGIAKTDSNADVFEVVDLVEKPSVKDAPSCLAVAARYVFSPSIFAAIRKTGRGAGNEIQLTDAIRLLMQQGEKVVGVRLGPDERRYDIGNYDSYFRSFVDFALMDERHGPALQEYLRKRFGK